MDDPRYVDLVIEIESGSDPIAGRVSRGDGPPRSFSGWLDLTAALEAALHAAPGATEEAAQAPTGTPDAKNT